MRKIVSFMHVSLDGFVATKTGELNWIKVNQEIFSYVGKRISTTDTALYGRVTFEMMEAYWPTAADKPDASQHDIEHSKWYKDARKIVLSKTLKEENLVNAKIIGENLATEISGIKQSSGSDILVFGSPTATHALMAEDLIDEYWLFVNPVLLSDGIPLFKNLQHKQELQLITHQVFDCGVVCLQYACIGK